MKRQWTCSRCGFACSVTTWQSFLKTTNAAVICNTCRSKKLSAEDEGRKRNLSPSNVMGKIGMIFGTLTFEAVPLLLAASPEPEVIQSQVVGGNHNSTSTIHIKQEYESEETSSGVEAVWDSNAVKKKRRSKLPQYTLSPLARFINHLQRAATHRRRLRCVAAGGPKYDDVLIYQKCLYVADNEIGLGAELMPPPGYERITSLVIKEEP